MLIATSLCHLYRAARTVGTIVRSLVSDSVLLIHFVVELE